ncbi:ATP-dependent dethiobiotin synthetase BioD [Chloropicon primus]|uniref:ATP-dependent dethiobiotin synthetase BioD n=1 Tax=Chloropicon primus TaxID=1764295 RepID=A0A5B8MYH1_9CHLO|nr:ATP-dependent dethiobiotin synthetase BioD [Chloropicon primus]|eukprot:QDZ24434.1 ATP-dependent dethiobiotin synthetase BioD [Chloropicon primus]
MATGGRLAVRLIWGSNTDVGKTLVSCALSSAARRLRVPVRYLKPIQTGVSGNVWEMDGARVARALGAGHDVGSHALAAVAGIAGGEGEGGGGGTSASAFASAATLFGWRNPVSPHLAVEMEGRLVPDGDVVRAIRLQEEAFRRELRDSNLDGLMLVEIAGGPLSPGPSGTLLADLLRPLRYPGILVGSAALGGITGTLSAKESIEIRGFDLSHLLILEDGEKGLNNKEALEGHVAGSEVEVRRMTPLESKTCVTDGEDYVRELEEWLSLTGTRAEAEVVVKDVMDAHLRKVGEMESLKAEALRTFWYPFVQHKALDEGEIMVIDSKEGHQFTTFDGEKGCLAPQFDACASWWTQGPDLQMQMEMAKKLGYAASRFGHVIFPTNVHEPVLRCTRNLLRGPGQGWASRVFYSDNGSTAIEVALKMAFRKYLVDRLGPDCLGDEDVEFDFGGVSVVTQRHGYHGDTLACMNAVEKSVFNGPVQFPWNVQQCVPLQPAYLKQKGGTWSIEVDDGRLVVETPFKSLTDFFDDDIRDFFDQDAELRGLYNEVIRDELEGHDNLGALLIEPVCQGAGGMKFIDPLWQRELVSYCRGRGIPVIFDEIFVGLYRFGYESVKDLLGIDPDIACYGKLLTGGAVPLGVTLAGEDVFDCFLDDSKTNALLHGHSYTAHPIGCSAANFAFDRYNAILKVDEGSRIYWDEDLTAEISKAARVENAVALGTVLAVELSGEQGYNSTASADLVQLLRDRGVYSRPLGNVVYFMCSPFSTKHESCDDLLGLLLELLR